MRKYSEYTTEEINENSGMIDSMSSSEIAELINSEDKKVAYAVEKELPNIAEAIEQISIRLKNGGRLIYIGAGTSGRLGVLDATECPPTYGVSADIVQGIIAGGRDAMFKSAENAEDNAEAAVRDLQSVNFSTADVCFAISASGSAQYVIGAIEYARSLASLTVSLSCNEASRIGQLSDIAINPLVGAEIIAGSTRMKAATAQKMVLTSISTGVMVKLGRVKDNRMLYMHPSNIKLHDRAVRIICGETGVSYDIAEKALDENALDISKAIENIKNNM